MTHAICCINTALDAEYFLRRGSDLLFLCLSLEETLISIVLQSPHFILQLLFFSLCSAELILHLLPDLSQRDIMLHQQAVPHNFLQNTMMTVIQV